MVSRTDSNFRQIARLDPVPPAGIRSSPRLRRDQISPAISDPQARQTKRKCRQEGDTVSPNRLEDVRSTKRSRPLPSELNKQEVISPLHQLSEKNLQKLNDMDPIADNSSLKRSSSRRSVSLSEAGTDRTQRSSNSTAVYRYKHLAAAKIRMHTEPPEQVQTAINRIIHAEVSEERRSELRVLAEEFRKCCLRNVKAQSGEDDFLDPLHVSLKALHLKNMCTHEKADWRWELKPTVRPQLRFDSSFMSDARLDIEDALGRPRKRQSAGEAYISPESSTHTLPASQSLEASSMPPPTMPPPPPAGSLIKTPRPDISIGIQLSALISALSSQDFKKVEVEEFLTWLQEEMVQHQSNGVLEPMLLHVPAQRALDLAFPFAVVEGKAYSTGKQIFEAENQASVSGACALKILLDLDDLVTHAKSRSGIIPTVYTSLFFTICTEGPIHELWAHWTTVEEGVRMFESKLLDSCNALLLEQVEEFIIKLNNIGLWGVGPFMDSVVERLRIVAAKAMVSS